MKRCRSCKKEKQSTEFYFAHGNYETLRLDCIKCGKELVKSYDWKRQRSGWPYGGDIDDAKYLEDRRNTFNNNGNGWWCNVNVRSR